jgi:hypothetical protein
VEVTVNAPQAPPEAAQPMRPGWHRFKERQSAGEKKAEKPSQSKPTPKDK